jgi:putative two-component system response regulator
VLVAEAATAGSFPLPDNSPIMVLDDDASLVRLVQSYLNQQGYPVRGHLSSRTALEDLADSPVDLLIVDLSLGRDDGLNVARSALEQDPNLAVILVTGKGSEETAIACLHLGLSDYLPKPFSLDDLGRSIQRSLIRRASQIRRFHNEELIRTRLAALQKETREAALAVLCQIAGTLEDKHPFLKGHSHRVADLTVALGQDLGLPESQTKRLREAGLIHDVGMILAPDGALCSDGTLSQEDLARVRSHATLGATLARSLGLGTVADYIEFHHERLDGSGYPNGLQGSKIPLGAMILGLAEAYSALTENRPFRDAAAPTEAIATLKGTEGVWFPTGLIDALGRAVAAGVSTPGLSAVRE